jgi:type VI protein secretion system component VasK
MFFVGAWVLMIFAGIVYKDLGVHPFGYVSSMVVSIGLWLTVAPAMGAVARVSGPKHKNRWSQRATAKDRVGASRRSLGCSLMGLNPSTGRAES